MTFAYRALLSLVSITAVQPAWAAPVALQSHRAVYDISLSRTRPGAMSAVTGRTVIEFRDVCTGYTTTQRFIADMTTAQGDSSRNDFSISQSEAKDGRLIRFKISSSVNGKVLERFNGMAELASADLGKVKLTTPRGKTFTLPGGTLLPTQHTQEVLRLAASGATSLRRMVYQGGDQKELYDTTTLIGKKVSTAQAAQDGTVDTDGLLKGVPGWGAMISYFPHDSLDAAADYEVAYRLYANGVISSMTFLYPTFTLKADLVKLEKLDTRCGSKS